MAVFMAAIFMQFKIKLDKNCNVDYFAVKEHFLTQVLGSFKRTILAFL